MRTITLDNGTVLAGSCDLDNGYLFMNVCGIDLQDGERFFGDPENTKRIVYVSFRHEYVYEGYTEMNSIAEDGDHLLVVMRRPANA